ncbi:hypothetical protein W97_02849 [Coniosporium apollinis CBS 100218]|uniref:AAA+ ATPase domain-containing protein n=1 Tax=Coniosporium apollinis (strain CBS 100218) TaxID=1168221 RepID=R7YPR1_CONA1|nr:uncharacterized protein W97_02849 [Coniosporium apollinis CBS 100218]EON63621.1 hypothetical protein W97_02849 [Coniosporium apollinis CBS 100218]
MSKHSARSSSPTSFSKSDTVLTPSSTPSQTPQRPVTPEQGHLQEPERKHLMDTTREDSKTDHVEIPQDDDAAPSGLADIGSKEVDRKPKPSKSKKKGSKKCKKHSKKSGKKLSSHNQSSSDTSSESADSDTDASSSESSTEDEKAKRKARSKRKAKKVKAVKRRKAKARESSSDSDSDSSDSGSESESEPDSLRRRQRRSRKSRRRDESSDTLDSEDEGTSYDEGEDSSAQADASRLNSLEAMIAQLQQQRLATAATAGGRPRWSRHVGFDDLPASSGARLKGRGKKKGKRAAKKRASTLEFKRVDQLWDSNIHDYKITESAEIQADEFDQYIFTVRRKFDWENKYRSTVVDIKSKALREALAEVMKDVKSVSLVEEQPSVDPNMLFLYVDELRAHIKTLKKRLKKEKKRKLKRPISLQIAHCKLMVSYLDEDYEETKKTLYPLLEAGNITFDLLWALFKPNTLAYTSTYGSVDDPRCFKVDYANKESSFVRGEWYCIEGRYLEYDGKNFGLGDFEMNVESFRGPRKITGLSTYPLKYHKGGEALKQQLIERGKRFVAMQGMNYRFHKGLAFMKKKKQVAKVNINGRIMIDPAIFRRINPNYPISLIKPKDPDDMYGDDGSECSGCCGSDSEEEQEPGAEGPAPLPGEEKEEKEKMKYKVIRDKGDKVHVIQVPVDEEGQEVPVENLEKIKGGGGEKTKEQDFTDEELLIASPVVLGFAFSEKLWLEFSLSGVRDIEWNAGAFESLVLPANQKSIVSALVSTHKFHAAETIDDVVQGKGRGLVFVLHGPPGVGKTLTAEGIAEYLKCPLYAVSAGELGTDSRLLEHELQKIMDIAHSWGAVLLLDEADVFLEKREIHDIHRNALVSIFLRLLEYFQGILFLTTNRVETFDDAFQSRIHVALRYEELSPRARKEIWKMFLDKVRVMEGIDTMPFKESDYDVLARNKINGRQIKNAVRTAQALAVNEKQRLSMEHIKRVLEVAESFDNDLKGGTGYIDAMRSYT